jgi:hypothetical protein
MRKSLYTFLYVLTLALTGLSIHQAFAQQRAPSVEPIAEIEIGAAPSSGYNFESKENSQQRVPAGIRAKESSKENSYFGPILFFILALPFAIWIFVSKKLKSFSEDKKTDYYNSTHQFQPYKTDYQKNDNNIDDDDIDYPKSA